MPSSPLQVFFVNTHYAALAVFLGLLASFGWGFASAFFFVAQKAFILSACFFL